MKKSLGKFEVKQLKVSQLNLIIGGDGSNCGTAATATGGADSDSDNSTGTSDGDTGSSTPVEQEFKIA